MSSSHSDLACMHGKTNALRESSWDFQIHGCNIQPFLNFLWPHEGSRVFPSFFLHGLDLQPGRKQSPRNFPITLGNVHDCIDGDGIP